MALSNNKVKNGSVVFMPPVFLFPNHEFRLPLKANGSLVPVGLSAILIPS